MGYLRAKNERPVVVLIGTHVDQFKGDEADLDLLSTQLNKKYNVTSNLKNLKSLKVIFLNGTEKKAGKIMLEELRGAAQSIGVLDQTAPRGTEVRG